jgi:type I restriction enzyme S subunit
LADGAAYPAVRTEDIAVTQIALPNDDMLTFFSRIVQPLFRRIVSNDRESHILGTLRDTLLPKLISGEVRVKSAERILAEAGV